jgi:DNA-binding LacI/PurR family transcriptional regulator
MMSEKRVTLRDVAAAAGVSRATAGFVLSDTPGITISAATRQRVRDTARDLGYVPHSIARALREESSRIIVLTINSGYEGNYSCTFTRDSIGRKASAMRHPAVTVTARSVY